MAGPASETTTVHLRDIAEAGLPAHALFDKGANESRGISVRYAEKRQRRKQLAADAMRDSRPEAKIHTEAVGLKLGGVLRIG